MSKLYHNTLNWSDVTAKSPIQAKSIQSQYKQYYTAQPNDVFDLNNSAHNITTNAFQPRRQSSSGIISHSQPQPLANLSININNIISQNSNSTSSNKHRPSSGSQLRTTSPLWNAANNTLNDTIIQPVNTRRQHSTPSAGTFYTNLNNHNTNDNNKLNFSRVTTLSTPANSQPVISANKLGISSVPLTTRAQSHYTSNNNTPSKTGNKLNNALDSTTKKGRHRQLPSLDGELLSAPAVVHSHRTQSHNNNNEQPNHRQSSASIKRNTSHTNNSNNNNDKVWPFDSSLTIQPSPHSSSYTSDIIQSPTKRSLVMSGNQSIQSNNVPILQLPTQPNGITAQQAAAESIHNTSTHRQPSAPLHHTSSKLNTRLQQRRNMGRHNIQSATINNKTQQSHMRTGSAVINGPSSDKYIFLCGSAEDANTRYRASMEDSLVYINGFGIDYLSDECQSQWLSCIGYGGVYDGHGGIECVKFIESHLHQQLAHELKLYKYNDDISNALRDTFIKTDELMKNDINMQECGSTVVSVLIRPSHTRPGQRDLYCSNVGDARAVLCSIDDSDELMAVRLSRDHTPKSPSETSRVIRSGGCVFNNRVAGQLAVSRALGDISLKKSGVIASPYINKVELNHTHQYCVLACDGLWDVVTDSEAMQLVRHILNPGQMAQKLVQTALERGTTDNVSVMCIRLLAT